MRPSTSTRKVTAAAESRMRLLVRIRGQPTIGGENLDDLFDRLVRLRLRLAPGGPGHPSWICSGLIGLWLLKRGTTRESQATRRSCGLERRRSAGLVVGHFGAFVDWTTSFGSDFYGEKKRIRGVRSENYHFISISSTVRKEIRGDGKLGRKEANAMFSDCPGTWRFSPELCKVTVVDIRHAGPVQGWRAVATLAPQRSSDKQTQTDIKIIPRLQIVALDTEAKL